MAARVGDWLRMSSPVSTAMAPPPLRLPMVIQALNLPWDSAGVIEDSHPPSALW